MGQLWPKYFEQEGPKNLHHTFQSFLDIFVTDRQTDGRKIVEGEIADRLMLVFVTDRRTDGRKIIEGEIADRLNQIHTHRMQILYRIYILASINLFNQVYWSLSINLSCQSTFCISQLIMTFNTFYLVQFKLIHCYVVVLQASCVRVKSRADFLSPITQTAVLVPKTCVLFH